MRQTIPSKCEQNKNKHERQQTVFGIQSMASYMEAKHILT
jgi:hypothetical protein